MTGLYVLLVALVVLLALVVALLGALVALAVSDMRDGGGLDVVSGSMPVDEPLGLVGAEERRRRRVR